MSAQQSSVSAQSSVSVQSSVQLLSCALCVHCVCHVRHTGKDSDDGGEDDNEIAKLLGGGGAGGAAMTSGTISPKRLEALTRRQKSETRARLHLNLRLRGTELVESQRPPKRETPAEARSRALASYIAPHEVDEPPGVTRLAARGAMTRPSIRAPPQPPNGGAPAARGVTRHGRLPTLLPAIKTSQGKHRATNRYPASSNTASLHLDGNPADHGSSEHGNQPRGSGENLTHSISAPAELPRLVDVLSAHRIRSHLPARRHARVLPLAIAPKLSRRRLRALQQTADERELLRYYASMAPAATADASEQVAASSASQSTSSEPLRAALKAFAKDLERGGEGASWDGDETAEE